MAGAAFLTLSNLLHTSFLCYSPTYPRSGTAELCQISMSDAAFFATHHNSNFLPTTMAYIAGPRHTCVLAMRAESQSSFTLTLSLRSMEGQRPCWMAALPDENAAFCEVHSGETPLPASHEQAHVFSFLKISTMKALSSWMGTNTHCVQKPCTQTVLIPLLASAFKMLSSRISK